MLELLGDVETLWWSVKPVVGTLLV